MSELRAVSDIQSAPAALEALSPEIFERFRELIYDKMRVHMRDGKQILLANRLRKRVQLLGLAGYEEYYIFLTKNPRGKEELPHFVDAVSTNETYFYRETNHLDAMRASILPELFARKRRIVIWSAGCSTGEEPYTLRILLEEGKGTLWDGEAEIVGTDISGEVIGKAREGVYRGRSLNLVPPQILSRYFEPGQEGSYRVVERIRKSIEFRTHALLKDPPPIKEADVIFCRNVMIYFNKETQRVLADDYFARVLSPNGFLCIGHSESLSATSRRFHYERGINAPVYRLTEE